MRKGREATGFHGETLQDECDLPREASKSIPGKKPNEQRVERLKPADM